MITNIFITGEIGVGKWSVFNKSIQDFKKNDVAIAGFLTRPIKSGDEKIGFELQSLKGARQIFAHKDFQSQVSFAKYKIDLSVFNGYGVESLNESLQNSAAIVIDEIGIMERDAWDYREKLIECMDSEKLLFAVFQKRALWFSKLLECRNDTYVLSLTPGNRNNANILINKKIAAYVKNINFCLDN
jgi:nucleoside-triphosphatase THEP1